MDENLITIIVTALTSGSLVGSIASLATLKFTRKKAENDATKTTQEVYQTIIRDMQESREELKKDNKEMGERVRTLETNQRSQQQRIDKLSGVITRISPMACALALTCTKHVEFETDPKPTDQNEKI